MLTRQRVPKKLMSKKVRFSMSLPKSSATNSSSTCWVIVVATAFSSKDFR